jgi:hypothetical protein
MEFKIEIPEITSLALKSNLSLPWKYDKVPHTLPHPLILIMYRWLNEAGIKVASEKR